MRNVRFFLAGTAVTAMLSLAGCGSNLDSGGDQTGPGTTVANAKAVGVQNCVQCHSALADIWILSNHGNPNLFPSGQGGCAVCHDPNGDSANLFTAFNRQEPERGVIGCEACHGGGEFHWGVGPIPFPSPGPRQCGTGACHSALPADDHLVYHPEGNLLVEKYLASKHGTANELRNEAICTRCHNHEGALRYVNVTTALDLSTLVKPVPGEVSTVQCKTCHDPHDPITLLVAASATASTEYNTCTNCHQRHDVDVNAAGVQAVRGDTTVTGTTDASLVSSTNETLLLYHAKRYGRIIAATHYDNPATRYDGTVSGKIEGYTMDTANVRVCRDCHDVHAADITINEQWAESGHAGQILQAKAAAAANSTSRTLQQTQAVQAAGSDGAAFAWGHYDWDKTFKFGTDGVTVISDRGQCQECHTATAFRNYMTAVAAGVTYDYWANDFSYLPGWTAGDGTTTIGTSSGQNELLFCWACHSDNSGALRTSGAMELTEYTNLTGNTYTVFATLPDAGKSNICVKCHGGRGNTNSIRTGTRSSRFQGHHAPTGGSIFNEYSHTGFEYTLNGTALNYANPAYRHDEVGRNMVAPESGDGPCVSCHMEGSDHTFEALAHVAGTTTIKAQVLCNTCHTAGTIGTIAPADLVRLKAGQTQAVDLLGLYINNGASFTNAEGVVVPADAAITNHLTGVVNENAALIDDYGAFQNWKYMDGEDPCAYLHNDRYAKRLIYDSIDWLNNAALDGNVAIVPGTYTAAAAWLGADTLGNIARP